MSFLQATEIAGKQVANRTSGRSPGSGTRISSIHLLCCEYSRPDETSDNGRCRKC